MSAAARNDPPRPKTHRAESSATGGGAQCDNCGKADPDMYRVVGDHWIGAETVGRNCCDYYFTYCDDRICLKCEGKMVDEYGDSCDNCCGTGYADQGPNMLRVEKIG